MQTEVISFYSDIDGKTYYSDHAKRLTEQLIRFNVPHDIREKPSLGTYQKNCLSKPAFIYQLLVEKQRPVVWLDIDSDVRRPLHVFDQFEGNTDLAVTCSVNKLHAAKASPIYIAFNSKTLEFLQHWMFMTRQMMNNGQWFDHEALIGILHSFYQREGFRMKFIGPEYCVWPGNENENSVIVMGLADVDSKKQALKNLGMNEDLIAWQSPGTK
jgi:hypothetical protein